MSGIQSPLWREGQQRIVIVDPPGAGKDWTVTVPTTPEGIWWEPVAIRWRETNSAVVANRSPLVMFDSGTDGGEYAAGLTTQSTAANAVSIVHVANYGTSFGTIVPTRTVVACPTLKLQPGHRIRSLTLNLDVGDVLDGIVLCIREWIYVPPVDVITGEPQELKQIRDSMLRMEKAVLAVVVGGAPT